MHNYCTPHNIKNTLRISWSIGLTTHSYLKCNVYDKLLKPRQSFWITLYYSQIQFQRVAEIQRRFMIEIFITPEQVRTSNFYTSVFIRTCNTPWCWRRISEWFAKKQTTCRSRHELLNSKNLQRETRPVPLVRWECWNYSSQLRQNICHWRIKHPIVHSSVVYLTTLSVTETIQGRMSGL